MAFIIGFFIFIWITGIVFKLAGSSFRVVFRLFAPYMAFFLIAGLVATLGMIVDILFGGAQDVFFFTSKVVAVLTGAALCLHLIYLIGKRFL